MHSSIGLPLFLLLAWTPALAQHIEAVSEDASHHVRFDLHQGVDCQVLVGNRAVSIRGKLVLIDSASFRLQLGDGSFTSILLDQVVRLRHRRYSRQHLASIGTASSLLSGSSLRSSSLSTVPLVAASALAGLGMALAGEKASFRRKDPSIYQGWTFQAFPIRN